MVKTQNKPNHSGQILLESVLALGLLLIAIAGSFQIFKKLHLRSSVQTLHYRHSRSNQLDPMQSISFLSEIHRAQKIHLEK